MPIRMVTGGLGLGPGQLAGVEHFTADADSHFAATETEFRLALGGYYRFNLECPQEGPAHEASITFAAPDL